MEEDQHVEEAEKVGVKESTENNAAVAEESSGETEPPPVDLAPENEAEEAAPVPQNNEEGGIVSHVRNLVLKGIEQVAGHGNVASFLAQTVNRGIGEHSRSIPAGETSDGNKENRSQTQPLPDVIIQRARASLTECCGLLDALKSLIQSNL